MKDAVLLQQIYPNTPGVEMLELTKPRHAEYCHEWHIDYKPFIERVFDHDPFLGSWAKVELIHRALVDGYDYVIWLDADTLIFDFETDLRQAVQPYKIGACWHRIPQLNHWNVGALYIDNTDETIDFITRWLASYPPPNDGWMEQGVFNRMAKQSRTVVTLSDRWNSTLDVSMVPDAVVLGFHGQGDTEHRTRLIKQALDQIAKKESAQATPADGVRRD